MTALLVAPDRYSTIRECLIVFISLSAVISALGRAADLYKEIVLPRWLKNNHVDPVGGVKEYLELTKDEGEIERDVLMRGAFYCADPSKKVLEYLAFAGQLLFDVAVAVAIYYMGMEIFSQNIQGVLTELPSDTGAVFQAMAPALIAAGVGGALMLICDVAKWALRSRWFKQNNFQNRDIIMTENEKTRTKRAGFSFEELNFFRNAACHLFATDLFHAGRHDIRRAPAFVKHCFRGAFYR